MLKNTSNMANISENQKAFSNEIWSSQQHLILRLLSQLECSEQCFFSEAIGYKTIIFLNFWRPFYFLLPFFFGIRQSATRLFILFNCYIHWVFIFLTSIFLFPRRYVTRLWQWRAPPCHWPAAPWPSTTRSSAPPSPGNSSNRKWPPWAPKNDEVGIVCTGHILLYWEWGWGWCNFAKKNLWGY